MEKGQGEGFISSAERGISPTSDSGGELLFSEKQLLLNPPLFLASSLRRGSTAHLALEPKEKTEGKTKARNAARRVKSEERLDKKNATSKIASSASSAKTQNEMALRPSSLPRRSGALCASQR